MAKVQLPLHRQLFQDINVHPVAAKNGDMFGVEVELEGRGLKTKDEDVNKYFTTHADNSLRTLREDSESLEYVFAAPLSYLDTMKAMKSLLNHLNSDKSEVFESYRTSIHVHMNCGIETYRTIYNLITLSIIFDELFVSQNGEHRIGNNFCLRSRDAQAQVLDLAESIKKNGSIYGISQNNRYSSVNFASLIKFGTIEYRSLECTTDFARVKHWIDTIWKLKSSAKTFENPRDVISLYSRESAETFIDTILGESAKFYKAVDGWQSMIKDGIRLAQDFAYSSMWDDMGAKNNDDGKKKVINKGKFAFNNLAPAVAQGEWAAAFAPQGGGLHAGLQQNVNQFDIPHLVVEEENDDDHDDMEDDFELDDEEE